MFAPHKNAILYFFYSATRLVSYSAGCRGRHPIHFWRWDFFFTGCLYFACSARCRGRHPLHAVYSYEWISLNLAIYMNAVRSRDVEDAIPYIWFIRRMNTDKYRNIFERCAFTGRRGRHPLHCFIWMSIGKYGIYMNAVRSRDVEDAIPYIVIFIVRTPSPTCGLFEGWIPINMEIFLNTSRSRDVCTSKSRCASQGRHPLHGHVYCEDAIPPHSQYTPRGRHLQKILQTLPANYRVY